MANTNKRAKRSLVIMQPYFFPYIGYFQLITAADQFIYRDDVQFVERGWIHRNQLLTEGKAKYITVPCRKGSKYQMIHEVEHVMDTTQKLTRGYLLNLVKSYYSKAPFFKDVFLLVQKVMNFDSTKIADLSIRSIAETCNYLGLPSPSKRSFDIVMNSGPVKKGRVEGVINICNRQEADVYINAPGGKKLYNKCDFNRHNIDLKFLEPEEISYQQFGKPFVSHLSIIDVMMFNSPKQTNEMLHRYRLT